MAIHVIQSQRIDVLLQGVWQSVQQPSQNPFDVLETQHFIVPSAAVQQWLTEKLSELQGITANYQFHQRIRGFQWFVYQQVLTEHKDQVRKANIPRLILKWRVFQALNPLIQSAHMTLSPEHPAYSLVDRIYTSADQLQQVDQQQQKKQKMLYWVAEQVSQLFGHYMTYRGYCQKNCSGPCTCATNWLSAWGENRALDIEQLMGQARQEISAFQFQHAQDLEAWQRWLWQNHFHQDYLDILNIDDLFWQLLDGAQSRETALQRLPKQVVVFTVLDLPPMQLQFLRRLGQYIDIFILHYNPSQEYWADSVDPLWKQQYDVRVKSRFIEKNPQASDADIAQFFDQFTLHFNAEARESRHPLLTRWGKQARDHFSLLANLSSGDEGQWVDAFVDEFPNTLLGQIQSDILNLAEPVANQYSLAPNDRSIQFHVCHSSLRQLEVLRDELIRWLADTSHGSRRLNDILVLVPNIKEIEPAIRAVFPATPTEDTVFLPIKIAGVAQLDVLNAWQAVVGRINLLHGRFEFDEFADWLSLSATQQYYALEDSQIRRMLSLLEQAGFKRGFDAEHLQQSLSPDDHDHRYSFKFALDRLALGIAIPAHVLFEQTLSFSDIAPDDFELIGVLIQIYQDLHTRRKWRTAHEQHEKRSVEAWLQLLMEDVTAFEQAGVMALKTARDIIKKQERMVTLASFYGDKDTHGLRDIALPLPYLLDEIQRTLENQSSQAEPTGQITFSQIGQIRPLPYALVVMLNLDTGKFPNRETHIPFDLMEQLRQQLGDRSRLEDDQGAFLDAVVLAKSALWLFYNGFDVSDGEVRDPSSIVQEFKAHLALIVADAPCEEEAVAINPYIAEQQQWLKQLDVPERLWPMYHVHPLQPFDPLGFANDTAPQRYRDHWYRVAQQVQQPEGTVQPWVNTLQPTLDQELRVVDSRQWMADVTFPARLYLKHLDVDNIALAEQFEQAEPLFLDGLGRYSIRQFLYEHDHTAPLELLQDQLPVGKIMHSAWQQSSAEQTRLLARLQNYAPAVSRTTQTIWRLSKQLHMNITVPLDNRSDWVSMEASSARAKRMACVWLEYLIWLAFGQQGAAAKTLRRIVVFSDKTVICEGLNAEQAKHYLDQWLAMWHYGATQPVVLPAALILKALEKEKSHHWSATEQGEMLLDEQDLKSLLSAWQDAKAYVNLDIRQDESSQGHRDWAFILDQQDSTALLKDAMNRYSYALYAPIFQYLRLE